MPIVVDAYEPDGDGGFFIQWTDPDQPVTAYFHLTEQACADLVRHHRLKRNAPIDRMVKAVDDLNNDGVSDAATIEAWRAAYEEIVDDIKELHARGLRHNTPHDQLEKARKGERVDERWQKKPGRDRFGKFMEKRNKEPK